MSHLPVTYERVYERVLLVSRFSIFGQETGKEIYHPPGYSKRRGVIYRNRSYTPFLLYILQITSAKRLTKWRELCNVIRSSVQKWGKKKENLGSLALSQLGRS